MHISRDRNVSIVFRPPDATKHCAGVEALLIPTIPNHKILFTASRDSTVKRWNVLGPEPTLEASFEGHADWVNDLALIGDLLITCSNDRTVRLWRAGSENGHLLHTLAAHSDYVTRLAAAPERRLVVSAGLRGEVFSYDVERGHHTRFQLCHSASSSGGYAEQTDATAPQGESPPCSVYSLALSPSGQLLAAGTNEALVRLLDPRTGGNVGKLRGHRDVVRALAVNSCGTKLLSGASDGAIKLWDVGMRRCVQTFQVHSDSVWSLLCTDDSLSYVYSAGRDRALFRTSTQTCVSELLAVEEEHVRALAVDPDARPSAPAGGFSSGRVGLWAATRASHVNMWLLPAPGGSSQLHGAASVPASRTVTATESGARFREGGADAVAGATATGVPTAAVAAVTAAATTFLSGVGPVPPAPRPQSSGLALLQSGRSFPALRVTQSLALGNDGQEPLVRRPVATIPGIPGIVAHEVLPDRQRVLTRDVRGNLALWDVLMGMQVAVYGKVDFDAKLRELWEARSVPAWFTSDHRLGCLSITLTPPSAFAAEGHSAHLGYGNMPADRKVNYGKLVLQCAFAKWRFMLGQSPGQGSGISPGGSSDSCSAGVSVGGALLRCSSGSCNSSSGSGVALPPAASASAAQLAMPPLHHGGCLPGLRPHGGRDGGGGGGCGELQYYRDLWPKYWHCGALPAVICSRSDGQRWRRLLTDFDGSETEPDDVPDWVGDVVLRSASVAPLEAKITFFLLPAKGSNLPTLSITRLQAPHVLEVRKVAKYTCEKLQEHGVRLDLPPCPAVRRVPLAPLEGPGATSRHHSGGVGQLSCPVLELTCNGMAVPYDIDLAAVKKYLCSAHGGDDDDLVFNYGVRDPGRPAPQPMLRASG